MSKKPKKLSSFEVNVNISPPKKPKTAEISNCILNCTEKSAEPITKFSETSIKSVYNAAKIRNDQKVISIIDSFRDDLPSAEKGYHRKCYQSYTHGKALRKLSVSESATSNINEAKSLRATSKRKNRKGMKQKLSKNNGNNFQKLH